MSLYNVRFAEGTLSKVSPTTFSVSGIRERQDLQGVLRDHPEAISPDLMVISEEFSNWEDSASRIDLLCLNRKGNLGIVELKRDDSRTMDVQAIRYAAMVSAMTPEDVVAAHAAYMTKRHRTDIDSWRAIRDFLGVDTDEEVTIGTAPRIILLASSFSKEVSTTVIWLNERGLDITCMQCQIYNIQGETYLDIEQVLPLPSASDYQVRLRNKAIQAERAETTRTRNKKTVDRLMDAGILTPGTRLRLIKEFKGVTIADSRARGATFTLHDGRPWFLWDYDDQEYLSLSALCNIICATWGTPPDYSFDSATYWAIDEELPANGKAVSLYEMVRHRPVAGATEPNLA